MKIETYSPTIRRREMDAVLTSMVQERVGPGEQSVRLVQIAKEYIGYDYCIALRSPATALSIALQALDLKPGCAVLISALSPLYYWSVLSELGVRAVCVDVDESTLSVTANTINKSLTPDVRAIVLHHTLGFVPDVPMLLDLNIPIVEDCSRSYGSHWLDKRAGSFGVFTILGLEERDVLTAGGGSLLYAHGRREASVLRKYAELPPEYKLPDINAALAVAQFKEAERNFERRKELAAVFTQAALRTRHSRPVQAGDSEYNNFSFPLILETGLKDVASYAAKKEVEAEAAFVESVVSKFPEASRSCPVSDSLALRTVLFPLYPRLGKAQVSKIAKVLATLP